MAENNIALKFRRTPWDSGMTSSNNLVAQMIAHPVIQKEITVAFTRKFFMSFMTEGRGKMAKNIQSIGNSEFQWGVADKIMMPNVLLGTYDTTTTNYGLGFGEFVLRFEHRLFSVGHVVRAPYSGSLFRIMEAPYMDGEGWCYKCRLVTNDSTETLSGADLIAGNRFPTTFTIYEEMSEQGAEGQTPGAYWMRNWTTIMRGQQTTTGSAASDVVEMSFNIDGKKIRAWVEWRQWHRMLQWHMEQEYFYWYGRTTMLHDGSSSLPSVNGLPMKAGAGYLEQIQGANTTEYHSLTTSILDDVLSMMQYRSKDATNKKLYLVGGSGARLEFNKAIEKFYRNYKVSSSEIFAERKPGTNEVTTGVEFVKYEGLAGQTVEFVYNPMFDNRDFFSAMHPTKGFPLASYDMYFMDFSDYSGESNVQVYAKEGNGYNRGFYSWWEGGGIGPNGGGSTDGEISQMGMLRGSAKDGHTQHWISEKMLVVKNPLTCGIFKYVL